MRCNKCGKLTVKINPCIACVTNLTKANEKDWGKMETMVAKSFKKDANRTKFWGLETEARRGLILRMIEDGVISYEKI